jgi:hypothetical protein
LAEAPSDKEDGCGNAHELVPKETSNIYIIKMIIIMEDSVNGSRSTEHMKDESSKQTNSKVIHDPKFFFYQKK